MGLLDNIAGSVLSNMLGGNSSGGDKSLMGQIAMEMLSRNGGLNGLLEKFSQGGLADLAASWVGQGQNQSVSTNQINDIFGNDMIADMASKFGIDSGMLTGQIAQYLPEIVNQVTPDGEVNNSSEELLSAVLGMLK